MGQWAQAPCLLRVASDVPEQKTREGNTPKVEKPDLDRVVAMLKSLMAYKPDPL
jgi:hypothetical protein